MEKWILFLKSQEQTADAPTHTQGEDFPWPRGQGSPQGADVLQATCFVQAHTAEKCSHRKTRDTWWLELHVPTTWHVCYWAPWLNHPGTVNLSRGASPFLLPRVITLVMLKPSETGSSLPSPNDGTDEISIRGGIMDTREEHDW